VEDVRLACERSDKLARLAGVTDGRRGLIIRPASDVAERRHKFHGLDRMVQRSVGLGQDLAD
jgi:hypothetical protein